MFFFVFCFVFVVWITQKVVDDSFFGGVGWLTSKDFSADPDRDVDRGIF